MLTSDLVALLESGALIVGTVGPDGAPWAARGWGLDVLEGGARVRLLLPADDVVLLGHLASGAPVAITAADVETLQAVQLKGRADGLAAATDDDRARSRRYTDGYHGAVLEVDDVPVELMERQVPVDLVRCEVAVDGVFDQTPGPGAGAAITGTGT